MAGENSICRSEQPLYERIFTPGTIACIEETATKLTKEISLSAQFIAGLVKKCLAEHYAEQDFKKEYITAEAIQKY